MSNCMNRGMAGAAAIAAGLIAILIPALTWAQTPVQTMAGTPSAAAAVAAPVYNPNYDTGSIAWMLTSTAFVLLMVPGLALFYGGMVRSKNVLNTFLLCMAPIGVIGLQWVFIGYAIAFPVVTPATSIIGHGDPITSYLAFDKGLLFLRAFGAGGFGNVLSSSDTTGAIPTRIPELVFVMFQGKFAIITPALIIGSVVERVRFGPILLFMLLWATLIYDPVAHWVWNVNGWLFERGALDFAGGTVVHILGGASALALCIVVGPRKGYGKVPMPAHSLGLTLIGAGLLWFGWFGFNAGSAVGLPGSDVEAGGGVSGSIAGLAFANTQVAAASAAVTWMVAEWLYAGKPTILGFASGMVAGLVVITPCAGFVTPASSIIIGGIGGVFCYFCCKIKNILNVDDSLDAFGVHGMGGALGAILVGIFAFRPAGVGGTGAQMMTQIIAVAVSAIFAFVGTLVLGYAIKATIGLRASDAAEEEGLDLALHGEQGYHLGLTSVGLSPGETIAADARGTALHAH